MSKSLVQSSASPHNPGRKWWAIVLGILAVAGDASAQCNGYTMQIVPPPVCPISGPVGMISYDLNLSGHVLGRRSDCDFEYIGYHWNGVEIIDLEGTLAFPDLQPVGMNDEDAIVGWLWNHDTGGPHVAFVRSGDRLTTLGGLPGGTWSEALAINEGKVIVGWSGANDGATYHAVKWENYQVLDLELPVGPNGEAWDVNVMNQIVGWMGANFAPQFGGSEAFLWEDGKTIRLVCPPEAVSSQAWAINDRSDVLLY